MGYRCREGDVGREVSLEIVNGREMVKIVRYVNLVGSAVQGGRARFL